jgi:hypothetical protein
MALLGAGRHAFGRAGALSYAGQAAALAAAGWVHLLEGRRASGVAMLARAAVPASFAALLHHAEATFVYQLAPLGAAVLVVDQLILRFLEGGAGLPLETLFLAPSTGIGAVGNDSASPSASPAPPLRRPRGAAHRGRLPRPLGGGPSRRRRRRRAARLPGHRPPL